MENVFKNLQTSQVLDKMKQIERDIPMIDPVIQREQWEARWITLKCWLDMYGELNGKRNQKID